VKSHSTLKSILAVKGILICLALGLHLGWIHLGDLPSFAGEDPKNGGKKDAAGTDPAATAKDAANATKKGGAKPDDAAEADAKPATKEESARRSFLSDLFTLPKLSSKQAKKDELGKYLDMAERKERQVDERTTQLSKKEDQLKILEKSIDDKLEKIDEERRFIAKTLQQEKDLKGERIDKIATLFEKMEPKKAAAAFEKLDKDLMVAMIKKLKQKQVTTIMENMSPEKSVELTEYFARVKSAKEYDILKELNESLRKEFQDCKGMPVAAADEAKDTGTNAAKADAGGKSKDAVATPAK
jgi:flagellar motility protein MotE (MotC chaperone)